jgi:hypothetical protein
VIAFYVLIDNLWQALGLSPITPPAPPAVSGGYGFGEYGSGPYGG